MSSRLDVDVDGIAALAHAIRLVESDLAAVTPLAPEPMGHDRLDRALDRFRTRSGAATRNATADVAELALRTEATARAYAAIDARLAATIGRPR